MSLGETLLDQIVQDILDPENRSIMLNPKSMFGSVAICEHEDTGKLLKVQNYAEFVEINKNG